jgi:hypothetical protein
MHFSVFAKMRKWADFREISFRENILFSRKSRIIFAKIFAKTKNSDFRENEKLRFSRKVSRKYREIFAKIVEETKKGENVRKKLVKTKTRKCVLFSFKKFFLIQKMQCCGAGARAASFGQSRSRNAMRLLLRQWY